MFSSINFLIGDKTIMPKYRTSYTVVKSFESQVVFEAPNDDAAAEMASDGSQWVSDNSSMVSSSSSYSIEPANEDSVIGRYNFKGLMTLWVVQFLIVPYMV